MTTLPPGPKVRAIWGFSSQREARPTKWSRPSARRTRNCASASRRACRSNTQPRTRCPRAVDLALGFGRNVSFRQFRAFAEKKLFHLLSHDLLRIGVERIQAVFVHNHFGVFEPQLPRVPRNVFVDTFPQVPLPRDALQARQFLPELDAMHHAGPRL